MTRPSRFDSPFGRPRTTTFPPQNRDAVVDVPQLHRDMFGVNEDAYLTQEPVIQDRWMPEPDPERLRRVTLTDISNQYFQNIPFNNIRNSTGLNTTHPANNFSSRGATDFDGDSLNTSLHDVLSRKHLYGGLDSPKINIMTAEERLNKVIEAQQTQIEALQLRAEELESQFLSLKDLLEERGIL